MRPSTRQPQNHVYRRSDGALPVLIVCTGKRVRRRLTTRHVSSCTAESSSRRGTHGVSDGPSSCPARRPVHLASLVDRVLTGLPEHPHTTDH